MKWYSVKKYIPPIIKSPYFVRTLCGEMFVATIEGYGENGCHMWMDGACKYLDYVQVTHFCLPEPVEIE